MTLVCMNEVFSTFDRCPCKEGLHENAEIYWTDSCTTN